MKRYAAKLLFQYRVVVGTEEGKRRICEERIVLILAPSARQALILAKRNGKAGQHSYRNDEGNRVHFEFIGVMELLHLGLECEPDEVWYEIIQRVRPRERKNRLVPPEPKLQAIRCESKP